MLVALILMQFHTQGVVSFGRCCMASNLTDCSVHSFYAASVWQVTLHSVHMETLRWLEMSHVQILQCYMRVYHCMITCLMLRHLGIMS